MDARAGPSQRVFALSVRCESRRSKVRALRTLTYVCRYVVRVIAEEEKEETTSSEKFFTLSPIGETRLCLSLAPLFFSFFLFFSLFPSVPLPPYFERTRICPQFTEFALISVMRSLCNHPPPLLPNAATMKKTYTGCLENIFTLNTLFKNFLYLYVLSVSIVRYNLDSFSFFLFNFLSILSYT